MPILSSLFVRFLFTIILMYVDDVVLVGSFLHEFDGIKKNLDSQFKLKTLACRNISLKLTQLVLKLASSYVKESSVMICYIMCVLHVNNLVVMVSENVRMHPITNLNFIQFQLVTNLNFIQFQFAFIKICQLFLFLLFSITVILLHDELRPSFPFLSSSTSSK